MKRTGKDLLTVLAEKLRTDAILSPKNMESIKKLPLTLREVVVEKLIALVKDERGYEEAHPEIKKIKGLLIDVDVDTCDVIIKEDLIHANARIDTDADTIIHAKDLIQINATMIAGVPCILYSNRLSR